jgi:hypothetical protein
MAGKRKRKQTAQKPVNSTSKSINSFANLNMA